MKTIIVTIIVLCSILSFGSVLAVTIHDGYTDKLSYRAGDTITFYINANSAGNINILLFEIEGITSVDTIFAVDVIPQSSGSITPWKDGFEYVASNKKWIVPSTLQSGMYLIITTDPDQPIIPIIIKGDSSQANIVIVVPTNTDAAYNHAGNKCFYESLSTDTIPSNVLSFLRPIKGGAFRTYSGFLHWLTVATNYYTDYNISVISDNDMDDYNEIGHANLLILIGHGEYWTRQARLNFDQFVDNNTDTHHRDAMVLGGNEMWWQVRYTTVNGNPQLICYKDITEETGVNNDTSTCDSLLFTVAWSQDVNQEHLKYSVLGSIGADWWHGGNGGGGDGNGYADASNTKCYHGFNGHKILLADSPLLENTGLNQGDVLKIQTNEFDGTLISNRNSDGTLIGSDPILDVSGLGFYRAELIGYDKTDSLAHQPLGWGYCPFMAFQKTSLSGKIINVSSNYWCSRTSMCGTPTAVRDANCSTTLISMTCDYQKIQQITTNMMSKLLSGDSIFTPSSSPPTFVDIKPASTTVSYEVCKHGSIRITPRGVYITDGYKVDHNDGTFSAKVIDCTDIDCNGHDSRLTSHNNTQGKIINLKINSSVSLFPNPNTGQLTININDKGNGKYSLMIIDISGRIIEQKQDLVNGNNTIDESKLEQGLYLYKVYSSTTLIGNGKISIIKTN